MVEHGQPFQVALAATRAGNLFTTHAPVPAGFDSFEPAMIERYLRRYANEVLKIEFKDFLALGRRNPEDHSRALQHGLSCAARKRRGQCGERAPRQGQPAHFLAALR